MQTILFSVETVCKKITVTLCILKFKNVHKRQKLSPVLMHSSQILSSEPEACSSREKKLTKFLSHLPHEC